VAHWALTDIHAERVGGRVQAKAAMAQAQSQATEAAAAARAAQAAAEAAHAEHAGELAAAVSFVDPVETPNEFQGPC
jgi:hypothetical protein